MSGLDLVLASFRRAHSSTPVITDGVARRSVVAFSFFFLGQKASAFIFKLSRKTNGRTMDGRAVDVGETEKKKVDDFL